MTNHHLRLLRIPIASGLTAINDLTHFLLLTLRQLHVARCPVLLQSSCFGGTRNGNHALRSDPCESNLCQGLALAGSQLPDLLNNGFVLVEVIALKLRSCRGKSAAGASRYHYGRCRRDHRSRLERGRALCTMPFRCRNKYSPLRRKSSGMKSSGDLYGKSSTSHPCPSEE